MGVCALTLTYDVNFSLTKQEVKNGLENKALGWSVMNISDLYRVNEDDTSERVIATDELTDIALSAVTDARPRSTPERVESMDNSVRCSCGCDGCQQQN